MKEDDADSEIEDYDWRTWLNMLNNDDDDDDDDDSVVHFTHVAHRPLMTVSHARMSHIPCGQAQERPFTNDSCPAAAQHDKK